MKTKIRELEWLKSHLVYLTCSSNYSDKLIPEIIETEDKIKMLEIEVNNYV